MIIEGNSSSTASAQFDVSHLDFRQLSKSSLSQVIDYLDHVRLDDHYPFRGRTIIGPLGKTRGSVIFRCMAQENKSALAIKFCVDPVTKLAAPSEARRQFMALQRVRKAADGNRIVRTPRPVMLLEECACIIMDWIDGLSVADALMSRATSQADVVRWSRQAGAWLAAFHQLNSNSLGSTDTTLMLARLERATIGAGMTSNDPLFHRAVEQLRRTESLVKSVSLPVAWRHGDFKAQNLLIVDGNLLFGLDLDVQDQDVIAADLAKFIDDIELLSWHPRAWRLRRDRNLVIDAFLTGYKWDRHLPLRLPLAWLRLYRLLQEWLEFETTATLSPTHIYKRLCFKGYCRYLSMGLQRQFEHPEMGGAATE